MRLKKHLRGRKSLIRLFVFLCFLCAFCAFCAFLCVKQKRQHFYAHKKHLRGRKLLVWRFVLFMFYVLFVLVKSFRLKNKTALIPSFILLLTVTLLFAPTGWICEELLNILLVETGIKYPCLTEIGKGEMIRTTKSWILPGRVRLFVVFLDLRYKCRWYTLRNNQACQQRAYWSFLLDYQWKICHCSEKGRT